MHKHVVSVSIGSSQRDHIAEVQWLGHTIVVERRGTDGDFQRAIALMKELDGKVDAFGMGGIDLYLWGNNKKRYILRAALPLMRAVTKSPIVDGSGLKNTLEQSITARLQKEQNMVFEGKKVLMTCALDRRGMAMGLYNAGAEMLLGDLMFALGMMIPIHKMSTLHRVADVLLPVLVRMPFSMLYPTGDKQHLHDTEKFRKYFEWADIIAGDFLYIDRFMPVNMQGKTVLTNTVTPKDIEIMRLRGVETLITTTPDFDGRSFGTNVLQAMMVAVMGKNPDDIRDEEYEELFAQLPCTHRIMRLQEETNDESYAPERIVMI